MIKLYSKRNTPAWFKGYLYFVSSLKTSLKVLLTESQKEFTLTLLQLPFSVMKQLKSPLISIFLKPLYDCFFSMRLLKRPTLANYNSLNIKRVPSFSRICNLIQTSVITIKAALINVNIPQSIKQGTKRNRHKTIRDQYKEV